MSVDGHVVGRIGKGLVALVGICAGDDVEDAEYIAGKAVNLRIFGDDEGRFNYSAADVGAELLVISQFTLYADTPAGAQAQFLGCGGA